MKKNTMYLRFAIIFFASLLFVTTSCKKDDPTPDPTPTVNHHQVMVDYMKANNLDLNNMTDQWVIDANAINTAGPQTFFIIDLRSATDFAAGRLPGAINSTLGNIITTAAQNTAQKPILVTCYTGQTAAWGLVALRLSGYPTAKIMKFGMSSWNADFDKWTANVANIANGHNNWSTTNNIQTNVTFSKPSFTATATDGAAILAERVNYMLTQGYQAIDASVVLGNPSNYFINNYWTNAVVTQYGHITGAYRINEDLLLSTDGIKYLDKDATVVTYCWTGQTSSLVSAYLTVLGYNAKSLKFGANAMIHDQLQANKWTTSADFPYEQ